MITRGIGKNVGVVTKLRENLGGIEITIPAEPQNFGAVRAALFAFAQARKMPAITTKDKLPEVAEHYSSSG